MCRITARCALTEASLDRRIAEKTPVPLPELLLSTGALMGPYRRTRPLTLSPLARLRRWLAHRRTT